MQWKLKTDTALLSVGMPFKVRVSVRIGETEGERHITWFHGIPIRAAVMDHLRRVCARARACVNSYVLARVCDSVSAPQQWITILTSTGIYHWRALLHAHGMHNSEVRACVRTTCIRTLAQRPKWLYLSIFFMSFMTTPPPPGAVIQRAVVRRRGRDGNDSDWPVLLYMPAPPPQCYRISMACQTVRPLLPPAPLA